MKPQHIEELDHPPIVGLRYLVPCVQAGRSWWPVMGPAHADPDLDTPEEHQHYDVRFMTRFQLQRNVALLLGIVGRSAWVQEQARTAGFLLDSAVEAAIADPETVSALAMLMADKVTSAPQPRIKVCLRELPTIPVTWFLADLEARHANARAVDCRTCPHRGMPLASLPVDAEGGVVCPGHGLRWSKATGLLMRRPRPVAMPPASVVKAFRDDLRGGAP